MTRYALELHPNKEMATFHFEEKVPEIGWYQKDKMTPAAKSLSDRLMAINGVVEVYASKQGVRITRGGVFTFEELEPLVVNAVADELGFTLLEKVCVYPEYRHEPRVLQETAAD